MSKMEGEINATSIKNIREKMKKLFADVMSLIKLIGKWWSKILYLSVIFVIIDALKYQRRYFIDDDFDNMMVDDNLRRKWRVEGEARLTPLRNWELTERYQIATSFKISEKERNRMIKRSFPTIIVLIIVLGIVVGDGIFTTILMAFAENAKFGVSFPGMEQGVSFSSFLYEGKDPNLQILEVQAFDLSTDVCLPRGKRTSSETIAVIFTLLFICLLSCAIDAYSSRLRAAVCHLYFPERARERANYLYKY